MPDKKKGPPGERAGEVAHIEQAPSNIQPADDQDLPAFLDRRKKKSWRDLLPVHEAADKFPMMSDAELLELGNDIKKNGLKSPIALYCNCDPDAPEARELSNWSLLDGRNRLAALEAVGLVVGVQAGRSSPKITVCGDADLKKWAAFEDVIVLEYAGRDLWSWIDVADDPYAYVLSANVHRRHLKPEDKHKAILALLKADPTKSNRQVGKETGASHHTVGAVRQEGERRGQIAHVDKRKDSKGRSQPSKKPKAAPAARPSRTSIPDLRVVKTEPDKDTFDAAANTTPEAVESQVKALQAAWNAASPKARTEFTGWIWLQIEEPAGRG